MWIAGMSSILSLRMSIAASGTVTLPTDLALGSADDYNVVPTGDGNGSVDSGTKTATGFDATVTDGPWIVDIVFNTPHTQDNIA